MTCDQCHDVEKRLTAMRQQIARDILGLWLREEDELKEYEIPLTHLERICYNGGLQTASRYVWSRDNAE